MLASIPTVFILCYPPVTPTGIGHFFFTWLPIAQFWAQERGQFRTPGLSSSDRKFEKSKRGAKLFFFWPILVTNGKDIPVKEFSC